MGAQDAPFKRAFSKCHRPTNKSYSEWDQECSWRYFSLSSLTGRILSLVIFPWWWPPPPLFPTAWRGAAQLNKRLKEKAIRKLERVAARQQMLLPYKLVEDYAWPAVPYKCPVLYHTMTHCVYHMVQHLVNSVPNSHISIQIRHWLGFIYVYDSISIKIPFWGLNSL